MYKRCGNSWIHTTDSRLRDKWTGEPIPFGFSPRATDTSTASGWGPSTITDYHTNPDYQLYNAGPSYSNVSSNNGLSSSACCRNNTGDIRYYSRNIYNDADNMKIEWFQTPQGNWLKSIVACTNAEDGCNSYTKNDLAQRNTHHTAAINATTMPHARYTHHLPLLDI